MVITAALFIVAQLSLVLRVPFSSLLPWSVVAIVGAGTVLSYAILAEYFPKELAGRANGALNVFHLGWAFFVQYATGLVLQQWPNQDGHYPAIAYQVAFGLNVSLQTAALAWFELPRFRALASHLAARLGTPASCGHTLEPVTPYEKAICAWTERLVSARHQAKNWRLAAVGSTSLSIVLGLALAISAGRAEVTPYVLKVDRLNEIRAATPPNSAPSDVQIAYFLARFIKNIRSLSTDPIVVRAKWNDALSYVTDREAHTLNDYARDANPFAKIGLRPVAVEVIYVIRASTNSFELRWKEEAYESGTIAKTEYFTGIAEVVFKPVGTGETLRNPLGLYVHTLAWSRDGTR